MAPSGYVCCRFERVRVWAVGRKCVILSEKMENNYLSGAVLNGYIAVFLVVFGECCPPQAAPFSKVNFTPFPGVGRQNKARKWIQRAE